MRLHFAKMHGLGNDFMIVDLVTQRAEPATEQIRAWGDRRTGVGFDQFLEVLPPDDPDADFRYRIFNADGSEAEQCGNGARCFARFVVDAGLTVKRRLDIQTATGRVRTHLLDSGDVEVDMGVPSTDPREIPFVTECRASSYSIDVAGSSVDLTPVSIGNPHAVLFVDDVQAADVDGIGRALQNHDAFPDAVNVGFMEFVGRRFARLRVYERGVGETLACGSGACAAMVAARLHKHLDRRAKIVLPGGKLRLTWQGEGANVKLSGPAKTVFTGRVQL
ncbi:MAG: diaminopimelate epimerase [Gammaproteobacteria bacterium]|nr:diaminopimelate epimerase [Gammaproteobacteria bacterium]